MAATTSDRDETTIEALGALAATWRGSRSERQHRTHLERSDFDAIADTDYLQTMVPPEKGGTWRGTAGSVRSIASMVRDAVLASAMAGQRWGTITSEPGSGGDVLKTTSVATAGGPGTSIPADSYTISGVKHFGSGSGLVDWMITTAVAEGETEPSLFLMDVRDRPWDGTAGFSLVAEWDGVGMRATQSHGMKLDGMPATRYALDMPLLELGVAANPFMLSLFSAVVLGVVDEAVATARRQLESRRDGLGDYERMQWAEAVRKHWLAAQAVEGSIAAVERGGGMEAFAASIRAKISVAELAEEILLPLTRVLGGGSFSQRSPFSSWFGDVRALGFLRPPWPLAHSQLFDTSW